MLDQLLPINDEGTLNSIYDDIKNCAIIKPTYHKNAVGSQKIMLDKRLGLIEDFSEIDSKYTDTLQVDGKKYYYGIDDVNKKGFITNDKGLKIYEVDVDDNSPLKIKGGTGAGGQLIVDGTENENDLTPEKTTSLPASAPEELQVYNEDELGNSGGFIKLAVTGASTGQYITFTSGILAGSVNEILYTDGTHIYITGTNVRGTLPEEKQQYYIFSESRETIILGAKDGLHIVSITDRDDSSANKYNLVLGASTVQHWSIKIDGTTVVFTSPDINEMKTTLESILGTVNYEVTIDSELLFLNKTNGSEIIFSEIHNGVLVDSQMIGDVSGYGRRGFGGFSMVLDGVEIYSYANAGFDNLPFNTNFVEGRYINISDEDKEISYQYFNKRAMLNDIKSKLPTGYTGEILEFPGETTVTHIDDGTLFSRTNFHNERLFITKDDKSEVIVEKKEFKYYYVEFDDNNKTVSGYTGVSITLDGVTFTANVSNPGSYHHSIAQDLADVIAANPNFRVSDWRYDSNRDEGGFVVSHITGKDCSASLSYPGTDPGEISLSSYNTTYDNGIYTQAESYSGPYQTTNINDVNAYGVRTLIDIPIHDIEEYNGAIFAMTNKEIYYSRITFDDNTGFYPLDRFPHKGAIKMLSFGKILLLLGNKNAVITSGTTTLNGVEGVVVYRKSDLEYNGNLFSKYSYIFHEGVMYVLQSDKTLVQLGVVPTDASTYTVTTEELSRSYRWLFEKAEGECFVSLSNNSLNFLVVNQGKTNNYKYDLSLRAWIRNEYNTSVYDIRDKVLTGGSIARVAREEGYTDFGEEYSQEINFNTGSLIKYSLIRTLRSVFGLNNESIFDVKLLVEYELSNGVMTSKEIRLDNFEFDTNNSQTVDEDDLLDDSFDIYNGTLNIVQANLNYSGRFIRLKYFSEKRFILGENYLLISESRPFVNNPQQSI